MLWIKNILDFMTASVVIGVMKMILLLPERRAIQAGGSIGYLAYLLKIRRTVILKNMKQSFPDKTENWIEENIRKTYRYFGRMFVEWTRFQDLPVQEILSRIDYDNPDVLEDVMKEKRGVIFTSAHFGNWELMGLMLTHQYPGFSVVAKNIKNRYLDRYYERIHRKMGVNVIYKGSSALAIARHLAQKKSVGLLIDQSARGQGIFLSFFGRPASFHKIPALLAVKSQCAFVSVYNIPQTGGRWRIRFFRIPVEPTGDFNADVERITQRYAETLEQMIRENPWMWFWFHDRWKAQPVVKDIDDSTGL